MRDFAQSFGAALALLILGFSVPSRAQEYPVNTYTPGSQLFPSIASLDDGNFVVVWQSDEQDGSDEGVLARRLAADGMPFGDEFQVTVDTLGSQSRPVVAGLSDGRFVVVWGASGAGESLRARFFESSGTPASGEIVLNANSFPVSSLRTISRVEADELGGFAVVWPARNQDGDGEGVRFRSFDGTGAPASNEIAVNSYTTGDQRDLGITRLDNGDFLVAWSSEGSSGTDTVATSMQAAVVGPDGTLVRPEFQVNSFTTGEQFRSTVTRAPDGTLLVAWASGNFGPGGPDGDRLAIQGQLLDPTGNLLGGEFPINSEVLGSQSNPTAIGVPEGFLVVWSGDQKSTFGRNELYGQRLDSLGAPIGGEFRVDNTGPVLDGMRVGAALGGDDDLPVLTFHSREDGDRTGIKARRLAHFFLEISPEEGAACEGEEVVFSVDVLGDGNGGSDPVELGAPGFSSAFDPSPVVPPESSVATIDTTGLATGVYLLRVVGEDATGLNDDQSTLVVWSLESQQLRVPSPLDGSTDQEIRPTLSWFSDAQETYSIEIATDPDFLDIVDTASGLEALGDRVSYRVSTLQPDTQYFWRVQPSNICGVGDFSVPLTFTTSADLVILKEVPGSDFSIGTALDLAVFSDSGEFVVASERNYSGYVGTETMIQVDPIGPMGSPSPSFVVGQGCNYYYGCPRFPTVGSTSDGEFLVLWNYDSDGFAQPFRSDGPFGDLEEGRDKDSAAIEPFGTDELMVVWEDSSSLGIAGQRLAADGTHLGSVFQVGNDSSGDQRKPAIARNPVSGDFLVAWHRESSAGSDDQGLSIQARRLDSDGVPIGSDFQVNLLVAGDQGYPSVAAGAEGESFYVVWQSSGSVPGDSDDGSIRGRRIEGDSPVGNEFQINSYTTGRQWDPSIASEPGSGVFLVSWRSEASGGSDTDESSVQARRFDSSFNPLEQDFQVNTYTPGPAFNIHLAASPGTGDFVVLWRTLDSVRAARIEADGPFFADGFESGDLSAWDSAQCGTCP